LSIGETIDASSSFSTGGVSLSSSFGIPSNAAPTSLDDGIIGFSFEINGNTHYGYFTGVSYDRTGDPIFLSVGTAFWEDTPNTAITIIPEPGSLGLMFLGAVAVAGRRRRTAAA
jgi:hypothetical protein